MSSPPARAPNAHEPTARRPNICDLRICEPLIATLALLIVLLIYGQTLPAPFVPIPRPPTSAAARQPAPTQVLVVEFTLTPTATASATPFPPVVPSATWTPAHTPPDSTPVPEVQPTATPAPQQDATPTEDPSPTPTEVATLVPSPSPTPVDEPTATPDGPAWNLAQDLVGLWEQVEQDWEYYFDFVGDGTVMVAENGARAYRIEGDRLIVIQMPGGAWVLTVRDLSEERLIMEGVFGPSDEFHRNRGVPDLRQAVVGLWIDPDAEHHPLEFTPGGVALGQFGRGTYRVVSNSHVLIQCDDLAACSPYREYAQPEDAPLCLRVYDIARDRITVLGLGYTDRWALEQVDGHPTLAADIVGLWEDESGSTLLFTGTGELVVDGDMTGRYEVLSETTLWVTLDGSERAWMIVDLDADSMSYTEMGMYEAEPLAYSRAE